MKNKVFLSSVVALAAIVLMFAGCKGDCTYDKDKDCYCKEHPTDSRCGDCSYLTDPACFCAQNPTDSRCVSENEACWPTYMNTGNNFYIIYMDGASEAKLGAKVKVPMMLRDYQVWESGTTLAWGDRLGINAFCESEGWISFNVAGTVGWNGGGILAKFDEYDPMPNLTPVMDGGYYLHLAIKSPTNQSNAGWTIFVYSDGDDQKLYFGPQASCPKDQVWVANYPHDGEWHHYDISVDEMMSNGYIWKGAINEYSKYLDGRLLIGFQGNPHVLGQELNLDAVFYYKK